MFEGLKGIMALPDDPSKNAAARQGLLAFGAQMLGGRGDFGGILGDGLMAGSQGYHGALAQQQQAALRQAQVDQTNLENQKLQAAANKPMQMQQILSGGSAAPPRRIAGLPKIGDAPRAANAAPAPAAMPAPAAPAAAPSASLFETYMSYGDRLTQAGYTAEAKQYYELAEKLRPKLKEQAVRTINGQRVMANVFEDGTTQQVDGFAPDLEKLHFANTGGATVGQDQFTGQVLSTIRNTQSPDSVASVEATRRGQNLADSRARELNEITKQGQRSQIINDPTQGPIVVDKGTGQARQVTMNGQAVPGEAVTKRETAGKNMIPLLKEGAALIEGATGSYWGTAIDHGARLFGSATNGAENIAKLKVLEGNIMMAQPRMEGPQSNMDVELYRQMAAQLGDPTVPNSTKKAALQTVYELYKKYDPDAGKEGNPFVPKVKSRSELPKNQKPALPNDISSLIDKYGAK